MGLPAESQRTAPRMGAVCPSPLGALPAGETPPVLAETLSWVQANTPGFRSHPRLREGT